MTQQFIHMNGHSAMTNGGAAAHSTSGGKPPSQRTSRSRPPAPPPVPAPAASSDSSTQQIVIKSSDWHAVVAVAGFIVAALAWMASNGYIDPPVHKSEITLLSSRVTTIESAIHDNKTDHEKIEGALGRVSEGIARIEGRISKK